ncbi:MFS transporter [Rhizobium leguminosarum]|uniref:spinster family MFS transporter n=1 Tax=Rhizobium TaxID=379 RepID=UPI00102FDDAC|nr:MFS transporter [Rhizobium leguminosarum]TBF87427.1 MFS transporter [Rhizobium leguminosarum]TBG07042.1 MFS transporter [Rhizobium leguminosarum]TBG07808.1 MFS transporter [Rhizobium leguminosarum]TBG30733.1 MFS transporter [Rhizobium leguminosarum]TBG50107.1 MFS transporter [Rhizobium leguminosarum]
MIVEHGKVEPARTRYVALICLTTVYTLNFIDRQIISILKDPIATELDLSDTELGLLGGLAFALLYTTLAIPVAWLADRFSRVWILSLALALWSFFTVLCGLMGSFWGLFIARMGVGIGEAGGVAPAYSLIADYFPPRRRATAFAIYSFGVPLGSAAGILFGGLLAAQVDWRYAFMVVGAAGLVFAPVVRLLMRDPRGEGIRRQSMQTPLGVSQVFRLVRAKQSFWLLSCAGGLSSMMSYGFMYWIPTFLARSFQMDLAHRAWFLGSLLLVGGMLGTLLGGAVADRLGQRSRRFYSLVPALTSLISAPLYALAVASQSSGQAFLLLLIPQALSLAWLGPVLTSVQHLGPPASRTVTSSLFLLINGLIGITAGPLFFGTMSDWLRPVFGDRSIQYAFLWGLSFYILASLLYAAASRKIEKDWVEA